MDSSEEMDGIGGFTDISPLSSPDNMDKNERSTVSLFSVFPVPTPEPRHFITKREKIAQSGPRTPGLDQVPNAPVKPLSSASRIFPKKNGLGPQSLSFRNPPSLESPHYSPDVKKSYFEQCFHNRVTLGSGSFGEAYRVKCKDDGKEYAVKKSHQHMSGQRNKMLGEVKKLEQIPPHPNIVKFICAWEEAGFVYIKMELCKESMTQYAWRNHDIEERIIWRYFADLLFGLRHLHNLKLVHMDIKPDNIFIDFNNVCKIGDMGLVVENNADIKKRAEDGDSRYLAREVVTSEIVGKQSDIFSLGMTILELATDLHVPSNGLLWQWLRSGVFPDQLKLRSEELQHVIRWMLHDYYQLRPCVEDILEHPEICQAFQEREKEFDFRHKIEPRPGTPRLQDLAAAHLDDSVDLGSQNLIQGGLQGLAKRGCVESDDDLQNVSSASECRASDEVDGLIPTCSSVLTNPLLPQDKDLGEYVMSDSFRQFIPSMQLVSTSTPYRQRKLRKLNSGRSRAALNFDMTTEEKSQPSPLADVFPLVPNDEAQDDDKVCAPRNLMMMFDQVDEQDEDSLFLNGASAVANNTANDATRYGLTGGNNISSCAMGHNGDIPSANSNSANDVSLEELNICSEKEHRLKRSRHSDAIEDDFEM